MSKIIAITQARSGSTRLPNKVLKTINGQMLLDVHLERLLKSKHINELIIATTTAVEDNQIESIGQKRKLQVYRGSEEDVLDRFYQSIKDKNVDYVVRLTSDCPLIDHRLVDDLIKFTIVEDLDYCSNTLEPTFPDGQDIEVFKKSALVKAWNEAVLSSDREHVTPYIWRNSSYKNGNLFTSKNYAHSKNLSDLRMTVDEKEDFEVIKDLIKGLGIKKSWKEYANFLLENDNVRLKNSAISRNEGFVKSLKKDK